eukprot:CAMPEP_0174282284 /NCGR_PEP_ID=MMETSP0809-20121228/2761_1 /TAXON_ID=73025 ORGANISM="Eutreptiella gymnastica-like, Strain CCMP1594" /NCGR_SAMPLE_ID=MMETSP0809 /ASSEMBLY_ACC=CAM_ASM_000658 /LENGTH=107 /DNA_ID=CAMNT_0015376377 /DNA_START=1213 /DNA_END=1534 /DNA_ORIENTATION=+
MTAQRGPPAKVHAHLHTQAPLQTCMPLSKTMHSNDFFDPGCPLMPFIRVTRGPSTSRNKKRGTVGHFYRKKKASAVPCAGIHEDEIPYFVIVTCLASSAPAPFSLPQ